MKRLILFIVTIAMLGIGCSGKDGSTGPMGPQGPQGPIGPTGPTGPPGTSAKTVYFTNGPIIGDEAFFPVSEILIGNSTPAVMCYISMDGVSDWLALPTRLNTKNGESTFTIDDGVLSFLFCGGFYGMIVIIE